MNHCRKCGEAGVGLGPRGKPRRVCDACQLETVKARRRRFAEEVRSTRRRPRRHFMPEPTRESGGNGRLREQIDRGYKRAVDERFRRGAKWSNKE